MGRTLFAGALLAAAAAATRAPRGFNTWDDFMGDGKEAAILAASAYMAANLSAFGWQVVTSDEGWYDSNHTDPLGNNVDAYGRPTPLVDQFPSAADGRGFRTLADRVIADGNIFGVWTIRGIPKVSVAKKLPILGTTFTADDAADETAAPCVWEGQTSGCRRDANNASRCNEAAYAFYASQAQYYAEQHIGFVKVDCMGGVGDVSVDGLQDADFWAITESFKAVNITVSLSSGNGVRPDTNGTAYFEAKAATMYRVTPDFWDTWDDPGGSPLAFPSGLRSKLDVALAYAALYAPAPGPGVAAASSSSSALPWDGGVFPDMDMLQIGDICHYYPGKGTQCEAGDPSPTHFSHDEQILLMSLWCATGAPLILGGRLPLRPEDTWTLSLLTNADVLALHGDAFARSPVQPVSNNTGTAYAWTAVPGAGVPSPSAYLSLFNAADSAAPVSVRMADLRLTSYYTYCGKDLWAGAPAPFAQKVPGSGTLTATVPAHGAVVLLLTTC